MITFKQYLSEGMIKLPTKLHEEMKRAFLSSYLGWVQDKVNDLEGKEFNQANSTLQKYAKAYGVDIDDDVDSTRSKIAHKFKFEIQDVAYYPKLVKLFPKLKEMEFPPIMLVMNFGEPPQKHVNGSYRPGSVQTVSLFMKSLRLDSIENLEQVLNRNVKVSIGILDHELTHAVQRMVLSYFHVEQYEGEDDLDDREGYLTSKIEFDPKIKTYAARFLAFESEMKRISKDYDRDLSIKYHVRSIETLTPEEQEKVLFTKPSEFFSALKKKDPARWKKAVKLFYQSINS